MKDNQFFGIVLRTLRLGIYSAGGGSVSIGRARLPDQ